MSLSLNLSEIWQVLFSITEEREDAEKTTMAGGRWTNP